MDIGQIILKFFVPLLEFLAPFMPGETFSKFFFEMEIGQQAFLAAMFVTLVSGFLGVFLLTRNLALIGDGLAHVSFGGVALAIVLFLSTYVPPKSTYVLHRLICPHQPIIFPSTHA